MEKVIRPYEIMVRLGRDGVETAHVIEIEEIVEDGQVTFARERPARPLELAGAEFGTLAAAIDSTVLAERNALKAQCAALEAAQAELDARLASAIAAGDALLAQCQALEAMCQRLQQGATQ